MRKKLKLATLILIGIIFITGCGKENEDTASTKIDKENGSIICVKNYNADRRMESYKEEFTFKSSKLVTRTSTITTELPNADEIELQDEKTVAENFYEEYKRESKGIQFETKISGQKVITTIKITMNNLTESDIKELYLEPLTTTTYDKIHTQYISDGYTCK
jgi:hypothetical protein